MPESNNVADALSRQNEYIQQLYELMSARKRGDTPLACIRTYGCQQNVADREKIKGFLHQA
ncbi:MAG: hypothetical protein Q8876_10010, partial [Bacillota bacterium]|nr:hypothetical protein [Bacillota bacterium]